MVDFREADLLAEYFLDDTGQNVAENLKLMQYLNDRIAQSPSLPPMLGGILIEVFGRFAPKNRRQAKTGTKL